MFAINVIQTTICSPIILVNQNVIYQKATILVTIAMEPSFV